MQLKIWGFTKENAMEVCQWRYNDEYSIYDYPSWEEASKGKWGITIEEKRKNEFQSILNEKDEFCGYIRMIESSDHILIGLGLKPELCGQGLGNQLMEIIKKQCFEKFPNKKICLEVREFNKRAIRCYEKAGFRVVDKYEKETPLGSGEFWRMEMQYLKQCDSRTN